MKRIFSFLFLLALTTAGKATPAPEALQRKSLKFAVISDLHQDIMHDASKRLTDFLQAAKDQEVDFIINLGDFCQVKKENAAIMKMWNGYDGEKHLALGNHDMDNCSKEEYIRFAGMPGRYYSFDKGDFHFIVLDPNHVYDGKKYIPYSHGNFYVDASKREFIDEEQMEWLKNDLRNTQKRCILFSHQCLENVVGNRTAVRAILEDENRRAGFHKVVAAFSGHSHTDYMKEINGIAYIQINSASNQWVGDAYQCPERFCKEINQKNPWLKFVVPYRDTLYGIVTVKRSGLHVKGVKSTFIPPTPQALNIPADFFPFPLVPRISDYQVDF